jgi:hypothetical protein
MEADECFPFRFDSDLRLQTELRVQQRIKETQGPNGHQNGHQFSNP